MSDEHPEGFSSSSNQTGFDNQSVTDQLSTDALNSIINLGIPDHGSSPLALNEQMDCDQSDMVTPQHMQPSGLMDRNIESSSFENALSDTQAGTHDRGFSKNWTSSEDKMSEKKVEQSQSNPTSHQSPKPSPPSASVKSASPKEQPDKQPADYDQQSTDTFDKDLDDKLKSEDSQQQNPNSGGSIGSLLNFDLPDQIPSPLDTNDQGDSQSGMLDFPQLHDQTHFSSLDSPSFIDHQTSDIKSSVSLKPPQTDAHSESDQRTDKETTQSLSKPIQTKISEQSPPVAKLPSPPEKQELTTQKLSDEQTKQAEQTSQNPAATGLASSNPLHSPMEVEDELENIIGGQSSHLSSHSKSGSPNSVEPSTASTKPDDRNTASEQKPNADKQSHRSPKTPPSLVAKSFSPETKQDKMDLKFGEPPQKMQKRQDSQQPFSSDATNPIAEEPMSSIMNLDQMPNFMDIADQLDWNQSDLLDSQKLQHQDSKELSDKPSDNRDLLKSQTETKQQIKEQEKTPQEKSPNSLGKSASSAHDAQDVEFKGPQKHETMQKYLPDQHKLQQQSITEHRNPITTGMLNVETGSEASHQLKVDAGADKAQGHSSRDEPIKKSPQAARADIQQVKDRSIASEQKPFDKQLKPPQMTQQQPNPSQQSKPSQPSHGPLAQTQHDKPEKRQESSQKVQHDKFNQREQKQSSDSGSSQQAQRPSQHLFAEGPGFSGVDSSNWDRKLAQPQPDLQQEQKHRSTTSSEQKQSDKKMDQQLQQQPQQQQPSPAPLPTASHTTTQQGQQKKSDFEFKAQLPQKQVQSQQKTGTSQQKQQQATPKSQQQSQQAQQQKQSNQPQPALSLPPPTSHALAQQGQPQQQATQPPTQQQTQQQRHQQHPKGTSTQAQSRQQSQQRQQQRQPEPQQKVPSGQAQSRQQPQQQQSPAQSQSQKQSQSQQKSAASQQKQATPKSQQQSQQAQQQKQSIQQPPPPPPPPQQPQQQQPQSQQQQQPQQQPQGQPQQQQQAQPPQQQQQGPSQPGQPQQQPSQQQQPQGHHQKEFNIISLCRFGQETVQDILSRFQEVFQALKCVQPPSVNMQGTTAIAATEKKVTEQFRTIRLLFKRLRLLFDRCNDTCQPGLEYTNIESLIPLKDETVAKPEVVQSEEYKRFLRENRELTETVMLKNKQLREIIDRIRIIIWEINTMLSMRRS